MPANEAPVREAPVPPAWCARMNALYVTYGAREVSNGPAYQIHQAPVLGSVLQSWFAPVTAEAGSGGNRMPTVA